MSPELSTTNTMRPSYFEMKGKVTSGHGGSKIPIKNNEERLTSLLSLTPNTPLIPGTLNLKLEDGAGYLPGSHGETMLRLENADGPEGWTIIPGIEIRSSKTNKELNSWVWIFMPDGKPPGAHRNYKEGVIELISTLNLKKEMDVNDGDEIVVRVPINIQSRIYELSPDKGERGSDLNY